jgi:Oxygenase domain of the 2OGFeDO superfamily
VIEFRMRSKVAPEELELKKGKRLTEADFNILLTRTCRVLKPDGRPLCVYLPGAIKGDLRDRSYEILHSLKGSYTSNRGYASGGTRVQAKGKRTYSMLIDSAIAGAFDRQGPKQYCRLTAWSGREVEKWRGLWPLLELIADAMREHVPERFAAQLEQAKQTQPEWVIKGTPFTTLTINNTYSTAVHTDKGDLDEGFSTLAVFRKGDFKGGHLVFPEYRLAADMQDGDLLLMDAHDWHGNTNFDPLPERDIHGKLVDDPGFERISLVSYFRTAMTECGTAEDEEERARIYAENRNRALVGD